MWYSVTHLLEISFIYFLKICFIYIYCFKDLAYLNDKVTEEETHTHREIFYLLIDSPNSHSQLGLG